MYPEILHLYGPFSINSFGICIMIGLGIATWLFLNNPTRPALIQEQQFYTFLIYSLGIGFFASRALYIVTHFHECHSWFNLFSFWNGGFSLMGAMLALIIFIPWYLKKQNLNVWCVLDLLAIYAPLFQAIARLGCFFAGCCYGTPTLSCIGISNIYLDPCTKIHPTQLYSSFILLIIFFLLYKFYFLHERPGQLTGCYLILTSTERFFIDYYRAERDLIWAPGLSIAQLCSIIVMMVGIGIIMYNSSFLAKKEHESF